MREKERGNNNNASNRGRREAIDARERGDIVDVRERERIDGLCKKVRERRDH